MEFNREEEYRYFQTELLKAKENLSPKLVQKSRELRERGLVKLDHVETGYAPYGDELSARLQGRGIRGTDRSEFSVTMMITRNRIIGMRCLCPECMSVTYNYYAREKKLCAYQRALLDEAQEYFDRYSVGDATDRRGALFLRTFRARRKRASDNRKQNREDLVRQSQDIELEPRLYRNNGDL